MPLTYADRAKTGSHAPACSCPACTGLECQERPRFQAGMLLSEADLNSLQSYIIAKNRLHNRYLHGPGVVCGLQVICSDCEGVVTIKQGYAIDPCGNDVVVCADRDFDVITYIRDCRDARKRQRRGACEPLKPPPSKSCQDVEEYWCLTIAYEEQQARPMTMLRQDRATACGCGCNGGGKASSCGCGCHGSGSQARDSSTTRVPSSAGKGAGACEPTRIVEGYRIDLIESDESCAIDWRTLLDDGNSTVRLPAWARVIAGLIRRAPLQDTLLMKIVGCLRSLSEFILKRSPTSSWPALYPALLGARAAEYYHSNQATIPTTRVQYDAFCRLYRAVRDLYIQNPLATRCALMDILNKIDCPPPGNDENSLEYGGRLQPSLYAVLALLAQYALNCICENLLPTCSPDPGDDRVPLACITIKNNQIIDICNFACRSYAGSFPSIAYWLSLVPIIPILGEVVRLICCTDLLSLAPTRLSEPHDLTHGVRIAREVREAGAAPLSELFNNLADILEELDPGGSARLALFADDFALPRNLAARISQLVAGLKLPDLAEVARPASVDLAVLVGRPAAQAKQAINAAGAVPIERAVTSTDDAGEIEARANLASVARGERVLIYTQGERVIGFQRYTSEDELAELRRDLTALRGEVAKLQKT